MKFSLGQRLSDRADVILLALHREHHGAPDQAMPQMQEWIETAKAEPDEVVGLDVEF